MHSEQFLIVGGGELVFTHTMAKFSSENNTAVKCGHTSLIPRPLAPARGEPGNEAVVTPILAIRCTCVDYF